MNKNTNVHTKGNAHAKGKSKNISLDTLMFKKEIKDRFHFKETTFQKWVHLPDVRAFKVGGKWAIRHRDVDAWEEIQIENKGI